MKLSKVLVLLLSLCGVILALVLAVGLILSLAPAPSAYAATVRYAKPSATGSGDCSTWANACTLQSALGAAASGDEIWVAEGTHTPGTLRTDTFQLKSGVGVYGGFGGTETARSQRDWAAHPTVLSGEIGAAGNGDNAYHVVTGSGTDASAVLDGFTVSGGNANGGYPDTYGGGMYNYGGSPTLTNVTFTGNDANLRGGGMCNEDSSPVLTGTQFISNTADYGGGMYNENSSPTLVNVVFSGNEAGVDGGNGGGMANYSSSSPRLTFVAFISNTADYSGGGMMNGGSNPTLTNVTFSGNTADFGGGMGNDNSSPTLTNVTFSGNTAYDERGGGMYNYQSSPVLTGTQFISNTADYSGGGMCNENSSPTLVNVVFSGNEAGVDGGSGGGMANYSSSSPRLTFVAFISNTAAYDGGGMRNDNSSPTLTNVTFSGNTADFGGGMRNENSSPTLINVIFSGNDANLHGGGMYNWSSSPVLTGTQFISNSAAYNGGGMCNDNSSPVLTGTQFISNTATDFGGGMYNWSSSPVLTGTQFISNTATDFGGGMYNWSSSPVLTGVTFSGNSATLSGGGMYNSYSSPVLTGTQFISNTAAYDGGGMWNRDSSPTLTGVTFIRNTANGNGGGMYNYNYSSPALTSVTFSGNEAGGNGGGIYNVDSSPTLVIGILNGNQADADGDGSGDGGGMYNLGSSPTLINTTLSANSAADGGGMANDTSATPSLPQLKNTILWGNSATIGDGHQIKDLNGSQAIGYNCMVEGDYPPSCLVPDDSPSPFVDADGADDIPGTADDDLHLAYTSNGIDAGNNDWLPQDGDDLDGDGDKTEKLPFDLEGNPRCFADEDLDGVVDGEPNPCAGNTVDLGAYEAQCYAWDMHFGDDKLEEGRLYRTGFHAETEITSTVTIAMTLDEYAAEVAAGNLTKSRQAFETALGCAATVTETDQAVAGLRDAIWELATGAMLQGNEKMVQALDVSASGDIGGVAGDIDDLREAIQLYSQATDGYLELLAGNRYPAFLAALQLTRTHPITATGMITPTHVDLERLAMAAAKKSRAYLDLAERYFRVGDETQAEGTLREGSAEAAVDLALLYTLWPEVVDDANYLALLGNMADMDRLYGYLVENKNPFGYGPEFVPFHYQPQREDERGHNNYEQTKWLADYYRGLAVSAVDAAAGVQQKIDDNYNNFNASLDAAISKYNGEIQLLCGDIDVVDCGSGEITRQLLAVDGARLRIADVLQRMENINLLIRFEQERLAKELGVRSATAQLISDTGEELASLAKQEVELRDSKSTAQGFLGVLGGIFSGATAGAAGGPWGALAGGLIGGALEAGNWAAQNDVASDLADVAYQKEVLYAKQMAAVQYAEAGVAQADSEFKQREYFLRFAELRIEYAIALNNLMQELARLNGMATRAQYLLKEKARAEAFLALLYGRYRDPAVRVLRNDMMEAAHFDFERALGQAYRAGRALEYEINQDVSFSGSPLSRLDDIYPINSTFWLGEALGQMFTAWEEWNARTDIPIPDTKTAIVYLSQAVGFEDTYDPDLGRIVTREEQFNAFVRDPANRVDLDGDDIPESLRFSFQTSIFKGNRFFPTNFFNDKIISVWMRVRGDDLGLAGREPKWVDLMLIQAGTSFMRTENSDIHIVGGADDIREYNLAPLVATIQAAIRDDPFLPTAEDRELATRSVANSHWILEIDMTQGGENQYLNLDNIDEMELIIDHEAYSLQKLPFASAGEEPDLLEPPPTRAYRPMGHVLPPLSLIRSAPDTASQPLTAQTGAIDLNDTYVGTAVISQPLYMPSLDLIVVLTDTHGSLSGYISATHTLGYPIVDESANRGPAISGAWSGDSFYLESDPFTTIITTGVPITRQVFLHSGVISKSGELLTGVYSETLAGLTSGPMEITGTFKLYRPVHELVAAFTPDPYAGSYPLSVDFTDLSLGNPTSWAWSFGDGATSTQQHPTHTYTQAGSFTVTLTISNAFGLDTKIRPNCITVTQPRIYLPLVIRDNP